MRVFSGLFVTCASLAIAWLAGCQSHAAKPPADGGRVTVSADQMKRVIATETTYPQLLNILGNPLAEASNGNPVLIYRLRPSGQTAFVVVTGHASNDYVMYSYISNSSSMTFGTVDKQTLGRIHRGMRFPDMVAILGPPIRTGGSGMDFLFYRLSGGGETSVMTDGEGPECTVIGAPDGGS